MSEPIIPSFSHAHAKEVNVKVNTNAQKSPPVTWKSLSLRLKATLLAVAISTTPVIVVGSIAYVDLKESNRQNIEKNERRLATEVQSHLNQYMWERFGDIQIMASLDIFTDPKDRGAATTAEKSAALEQFLKAYPVYDSIAVFDLKGDPIAQTSGPPLPNHSDRSYIKAALQTKGPVLSQPAISASSGVFSVYAAAPIRDRDSGEIIGTVRARIPVTKFRDLIQALQPQKGVAYYLINAAGEVFYGPEGVYVSPVNSRGDQVKADEKNFKEKPIESIFVGIGAIKATKQAGSLFTMDPATRAQQFVTYVPPTTLKGLPDLNWSVVLASDANIVFATQKQQLRIFLVGLWLTLLVVTVVTVYLVNRGLRPVLSAAEVVEKIGQGHLDTRIAVKGSDELATLGANINQMADKIQDLLRISQQSAEQLKEQNDVLSELARHEALVQGNVKAAAYSFT